MWGFICILRIRRNFPEDGDYVADEHSREKKKKPEQKYKGEWSHKLAQNISHVIARNKAE